MRGRCVRSPSGPGRGTGAGLKSIIEDVLLNSMFEVRAGPTSSAASSRAVDPGRRRASAADRGARHMDAEGASGRRRQDRLGAASGRPGTLKRSPRGGAPPRSERPGAAGGLRPRRGRGSRACPYTSGTMESKFERRRSSPLAPPLGGAGGGRADATSDRPSFTIALPPPTSPPAAHGPRHGRLGPGHSGPPLADARCEVECVPAPITPPSPPMR